MAGDAVPFPVKESIPCFSVACGRALGRRRIQRAQPAGKSIELVSRQVERGHASTRRSFADKGAQLLRGTAAYATIPCQTRAAVRAARVPPRGSRRTASHTTVLRMEDSGPAGA